MKNIIITGGSGFLGSQIINTLIKDHRYHIIVVDLVPPMLVHPRVSFVKKNLLEAFCEQEDLDLLKNPYAVIHLSGKNIFGRFTKKHKKLVRDTRVKGTQHLVELFSKKEYRPETFVCASAVGFYGDQPGVTITESTKRKNYYFLSDVVHDWEQEARKAEDYGVKVSCVRNGHIIGRGGIVGKVASYVILGIGSILGRGREHFPWIDIRDLINIYTSLIDPKNNIDIINGVSGSCDTQESFARAIGSQKKVRAYIHIPQWLLWITYGSFGKEMLVDQYILSENNTLTKIQHTSLTESINHHLTH